MIGRERRGHDRPHAEHPVHGPRPLADGAEPDVISESEVMAPPPDAVIARMAALLADAARAIAVAIVHLGNDADKATKAADAAISAERELERAYYRGMADLLEVEDRRQRIARRELYRRCTGIGETVVDVAERIVYAVVKQG
jgi:uncharacterized protein Yka (UPF0111/DUF47 family)